MLRTQNPIPPSPALATAAGTKPRITESLVLDWKDLKSEPRPNGERRDAFDGPTGSLANFECHVTTLNPGEGSVPHTHDTPVPTEEAILLKAGTLEVSVNGVKKTVGAGAVIYFAPKDLTGVKNPGKVPAVYFVVSAQAAAAAAK